MIRNVPKAAFLLLAYLPGIPLSAGTSITSNGVTWSLAGDHKHGVFVTGDPWVVGPVTIVGIDNSLNDRSYKPRPGQNGSMVNPGVDTFQGYDSGMSNYKAELNAGLPSGNAVSPANPVKLAASDTLVSAVSWLFNSPTDVEPGAPKYSAQTKTTRPALRSMGILTVVAAPPPPDAFRPGYSAPAGNKSDYLRASRLDYARLPKLPAPETAGAPTVNAMAGSFAKPWVDHVNDWMSDYLHPSEHMPHYGRDMGRVLIDSILAVSLDDSPRGKNPAKDSLVAGLVQYGIDCAGIADRGGGWPANGGHCTGRKLPILFAGALLGDQHMLEAGRWKTRFQEDEQTFYVTQAEVDLTNGPEWKPDKRAKLIPYKASDIGTAEWGIVHAAKPAADNASFDATYREVNGAVIPGFALIAELMDLRAAWNHEPFFDYAARYMRLLKTEKPGNRPSPFVYAQWDARSAK